MTITRMFLYACCACALACGSSPQDSPASSAASARLPSEGSDLAGDASVSSSSVSASPASSACAAIASLRVDTSSPSSVSLAWAGSEGTVVTVARKSYCGSDPYVALTGVPAGATSYVDPTVQPSWSYWYEVTATDPSGVVATSVIGASASDAAPSCAGGAAPQATDVPASQVCSGTTSVDAGPAGGGGPPAASAGDAGVVPIVDVTPGAQVLQATDSAAAITSAIEGCAQGVIHFAAGTYKLTSTIHVPPNCQLEGELGWQSIITGGVNNSGLPIFQLDRSSNVTITRLNFQNVNSQAISNYNGSGSGNIENTHIYLNLFDHFGNNNPIWLFDPPIRSSRETPSTTSAVTASTSSPAARVAGPTFRLPT